MAEQVEKNMPQQETLLVVTDDVPEPEDENTNHENHQKNSLLVPEPEFLPANIPSSKISGHENVPLKSEDTKPPPQNQNQDFTKIANLPENEQKALQELKHLVKDKHAFGISEAKSPPPPPPTQSGEEKTTPPEKDPNNNLPEPSSPQTIAKTLLEDDGAKTLEAIQETIISSSYPVKNPESIAPPEQVSIWGVKLMDDDDEKTDVVLLKFLRARDFKVKEAFTMLKNTLNWRKQFKIDDLINDDLGDDELKKVVFMHGFSKQGNPVCYNVYGEFQNKELYQKMFSAEEKRQRFLRWRIQFLEKSIIRDLDFSYGGVSTIVQVNDLKNSPGPNRWELRQATNQALQLLQDNYPEFVAKQVFINVPWWYLALSKMISPFLTQRTKSKFVVAGPSRSTETLFKYISAEQIPTQYGGLSKEDGEFGVGDNVTEIIVKPSAKHIVEFPVTQTCNVSWEIRVVGWEVSYGAEFLPSSEDSYTIILQKMRRIGSTQEQVISGSYKAGELGKLVLTINNVTTKKKKLLYRFKTKLSDN